MKPITREYFKSKEVVSLLEINLLKYQEIGKSVILISENLIPTSDKTEISSALPLSCILKLVMMVKTSNTELCIASMVRPIDQLHPSAKKIKTLMKQV